MKKAIFAALFAACAICANGQAQDKSNYIVMNQSFDENKVDEYYQTYFVENPEAILLFPEFRTEDRNVFPYLCLEGGELVYDESYQPIVKKTVTVEVVDSTELKRLTALCAQTISIEKENVGYGVGREYQGYYSQDVKNYLVSQGKDFQGAGFIIQKRQNPYEFSLTAGVAASMTNDFVSPEAFVGGRYERRWIAIEANLHLGTSKLEETAENPGLKYTRYGLDASLMFKPFTFGSLKQHRVLVGGGPSFQYYKTDSRSIELENGTLMLKSSGLEFTGHVKLQYEYHFFNKPWAINVFGLYRFTHGLTTNVDPMFRGTANVGASVVYYLGRDRKSY